MQKAWHYHWGKPFVLCVKHWNGIADQVALCQQHCGAGRCVLCGVGLNPMQLSATC